MFRALAVIAAFAILVYALADFASSDERDRGGIPRWLWAVLIVCLPYFGPLSWIVFSRTRRHQTSGPSSPPAGPTRARRRPTGPLAPDDDPEFLWRLGQEQRNQARAAANASDTAPDATPAATPTGPPTAKPAATPQEQQTPEQPPRDAAAHDQTTPPDDHGQDPSPQP